jgi:non-canonical (house-cleaning) NTP pyrophosphatase
VQIVERAEVVVGSNRIQKLMAVRKALESFGDALDPNAKFEVIGIGADSGVSDMPRSRGELMAGARGRAESLVKFAREGGQRWRYFVGLEGGIDVTMENGRRWPFLESWAFVSDGLGREAYGYAGGILLPEPLAEEVLDRGTELAVAIDEYAGGRGIRNDQGAWGVLTRGIITRQESCRIAVIHAFAPFFNAPLYP